MRKMSLVVCCFSLLSFCCPHAVSAAAWDRCKGCHNGNVAPDEKTMKQQYPTMEKFVQAAKKSDDPFMGRFKNDEKLLKEAAQEIGLK